MADWGLRFVAALLLGIAFVYSFKRAAGAIVKGMIGVQLLAPLVGAIALFSIGETGAGVALLVLFALTALLVYLVRHKIELVIRLVGRPNPFSLLSPSWGWG